MAFDLDMYLQLVHDRFQKDNFRLYQDTVANVEVTVATMRELNASWTVTKLHIFGIYGVLNEVTKTDIERFSEEAFNFAKHNYPALDRGLVSSFASISALITMNATQEAKNWVAYYSKKHFGFYLPVLVDLSKPELIYCRKKPIWGRLYYGHLYDFIEQYYNPLLGAI